MFISCLIIKKNPPAFAKWANHQIIDNPYLAEFIKHPQAGKQIGA